MPFSAAVAASESRMCLEASEMSVSPAVKRLKPPPLPEMPTFTSTSRWNLRYSSATASVTGATVLDPSISIVPVSVFAGAEAALFAPAPAAPACVAAPDEASSPPPHAARAIAPTSPTSSAPTNRRPVRRPICAWTISNGLLSQSMLCLSRYRNLNRTLTSG